MLGLLSEDVIWRVLRYLDVKSRIRLGAVSTAFHKLLNKWEDVLCCSIRLHGITLSGESFVIEVEGQHTVNRYKMVLVPLLKRCPMIRKLAIHDERVLRNVDNVSLLRDLVNVDELHISSNFFAESTHDSLVDLLSSFPKLHLLHVKQRYNEDKCCRNIVREYQMEQLASTSLNNIKLQGVVVTGSVLKLLCSKYRKTLERLCLMGALIPSYEAYACFQAINGLDRLIYLTLAPSLYSVSTTNKTFFKSYPSLKDSQRLKLVAAYISRPDVSQLKLLLQQILPANVEKLLLYDESYRSAYQIEGEPKEFKCKLPEWYCVLSELMETALMSEDSSELDECSCTDHSKNSLSCMPNLMQQLAATEK
uniref:F-box domain-containing protein n=1 Tax=Setaria digitata TaxID=48799 RepID=A0A915PEE8_9BILA